MATTDARSIGTWTYNVFAHGMETAVGIAYCRFLVLSIPEKKELVLKTISRNADLDNAYGTTLDQAERLGPRYPQAVQVLGVLLNDVKRWYPDLSAEFFLRKFITKIEETLRPEDNILLEGILNHCLDIWIGSSEREVLSLLYTKCFNGNGYNGNVCPFIGCYQLKPDVDPIKHMQLHIKEAAERVQVEVVREQTTKG